MPQRFRLLTEAHVTALLPLTDLIASMETALARFSAGEVLQPVRTVLSVGPTKAYYGLMPAYVADPPQLGAKIGLDDAGVSESRALGGTVVGIGKYISPRLYVSYGVSLLGTGQVITLKYLLRKGFDIEIESSTVENRGSVNWRREK